MKVVMKALKDFSLFALAPYDTALQVPVYVPSLPTRIEGAISQVLIQCLA